MAISFKGAHFPQDIILMGVRWYVAYPLSYRHVEELMEERGVSVDHTTIQRWVVKYSPLNNVKIQHIVLYFVRATGKIFEVPVTHLHFIELDGTATPGGGAISQDGIISTRRGNAARWAAAMPGRAPFGTWELAIPDTGEMRKRFTNEDIQDILFVITYAGHTPAWPA